MEHIATDILNHILGMLDEPTYIRIIERVCKRWKAVSRSRTSIRSERHGPMAILELYPKLTHCYLPLRIFHRNMHLLNCKLLKYVELTVRIQSKKGKRQLIVIRTLIEAIVASSCIVKLHIKGTNSLHFIEGYEVALWRQSMNLLASSGDHMVDSLIEMFVASSHDEGELSLHFRHKDRCFVLADHKLVKLTLDYSMIHQVMLWDVTNIREIVIIYDNEYKPLKLPCKVTYQARV